MTILKKIFSINCVDVVENFQNFHLLYFSLFGRQRCSPRLDVDEDHFAYFLLFTHALEDHVVNRIEHGPAVVLVEGKAIKSWRESLQNESQVGRFRTDL